MVSRLCLRAHRHMDAASSLIRGCHCAAEGGAAGTETSAPFQPQLNFSSYSRSPAPVADKPDDTKLIDGVEEEPSAGKGRR